MPLIDLRDATMYIVSGMNNVEIKIGEGNLTYIEKRNIDLVKSRGILDTTREGEEEGMEVSFNFMWEFLKAKSGDPITIEQALKGAWTSTSTDPAAPKCVDLVILHNPQCTGIQQETVTLSRFNYTQLAHSIRDSTVACNGVCNSKEAVIVRS